MPDTASHERGTVIALAGRRIDASGGNTRRFPAENINLVSGRIRDLFENLKPVALVSSAACGADLLALEVAGALGTERHIILPFPPEIFRKTSVADRGGDWGERYDRVLANMGLNEEIVCLNYPKQESTAYSVTNQKILVRAQELASQKNTGVQVVIVWDGTSRGADDSTVEFANDAQGFKFRVTEISTL